MGNNSTSTSAMGQLLYRLQVTMKPLGKNLINPIICTYSLVTPHGGSNEINANLCSYWIYTARDDTMPKSNSYYPFGLALRCYLDR